MCAGLFQQINHPTTGSSGSCPPIRTAVVSGDAVASAAVRRRQRRSIPKITLTTDSKTFHDQFDLIHRHQTRLRGRRCDRLKLADALDNPMRRKTIVFAMKVYDIIHLIENGTYLDFPQDIPIPCDLQVERVARTSGITDSEDENKVMAVWAEVASQVSEDLGRPISLLRIDSIVWQSGQIIGEYEPDQEAAQQALIEHFEQIGLDGKQAGNLAEELTAEM